MASLRLSRRGLPTPGGAERQVWTAPWFLEYFQSPGLLTLGDLPIALAGRTSHKAGTSSLFTRHTGVCWLAATSAEVVDNLADTGWVIR